MFAAGEGGRVLQVIDGRCETLTVDTPWEEGVPTFWGLWARAADDVTLVGGSTADGPRGVLADFDGAHVTRADDRLPTSARGRNLYKIAEGALGAFIVGEGGTGLLRADDGRWAPVATSVRADDNRLFTVSCDRVVLSCVTVGGAASGVVLQGDPAGWRPRADLGELPGLAGVSMQDASGIFLVGAYSFTFLRAIEGVRSEALATFEERALIQRVTAAARRANAEGRRVAFGQT